MRFRLALVLITRVLNSCGIYQSYIRFSTDYYIRLLIDYQSFFTRQTNNLQCSTQCNFTEPNSKAMTSSSNCKEPL